MLMVNSSHLLLLLAILSWRGLGSAVVHLPTWAQEGILGEKQPGVPQPGKRDTKWWAGAERGH